MKVRRANLDDASVILDIAKANHYDRTKHDKVSSKGFILTELSKEESCNYISKEIVHVIEDSSGIHGFTIATHPHNQRYEKLSDPKLKWNNDDIEKLYLNEKLLYLWLIAVDPSSQLKGLGKILMEECIVSARELCFAGLFADYMIQPIKNERSKNFFCNRNFKISGTLDLSDYYGTGTSKYEICVFLF